MPMDAQELLDRQLPPIQWAIPDILPEGLTLLAGKPKLGKSWLALAMALAVAAGGVALGTYPVTQGEVLYLALEDNVRRLQARAQQLLASMSSVPNTIAFELRRPRLDQGGLTYLEEYLQVHPNVRLVVVDTWARVSPKAQHRQRSQYEDEYEALTPLKYLADTYRVSILAIHHLRKMEAAGEIQHVNSQYVAIPVENSRHQRNQSVPSAPQRDDQVARSEESCLPASDYVDYSDYAHKSVSANVSQTLSIPPPFGGYSLQFPSASDDVLSPQHIQALYAQKLKEGLSATSVHVLHAILHKAFDHAVRLNLLSRNICDVVSPPRAEKHEIHPLSLEQIQQLLTSAKGHHLETLFVLALVTGMRRGELLALKWKDVNFAESTLYVRRACIEVAGKGIIETEPKTAKGRRSIHLPPLAIEALKSHRTKQLEA